MAAAAAPALYDTIYDVLLNNQALYAGTHAINPDNQTELYHEVSKLLTYFALADLRHDFENELDIDIYVSGRSRQSIGMTQCNYICEAFYAAGSKCYNSLSFWARDKFMKEMSSDGTAKANFKKRMDDFFSGTGVFNKFRTSFNANSYSRPFDMCHSIPIAYNEVADKSAIVGQLTLDPRRTVILVDSQMGNPLENIFNSSATKNQASYIVNFATTMDAATKPTANVHTYLNVLIQKDAAVASTQPLQKELSLFGPNTRINSFNFTVADTWNTEAQIDFSQGESITMSFSKNSKASVNELAVVPVRGMSRAEIETAIASIPERRLSQVSDICASHQFKSLGDRLQALSVSKYLTGSILYVLNTREGHNGSLRDDKRAVGNDVSIYGSHKITFINDILNLYQNWLLQNNFVDTGDGIITYYENTLSVDKSELIIQNDFIKRKLEIHKSIRNDFNIHVDTSTLRKVLESLYNASVNHNALLHIRHNDLLKNFIDAAPSDAEIKRTITRDNYKVYDNYTTPAFSKYVKEITNTRISQNSYTLAINDILIALNIHNASITADNISSAIITHINGLIQILVTIEERLKQLNFTKFTFFLALLLIKYGEYPNINALFSNEQFYKSIFDVEGRAARRSIFLAKLNDAIQYIDNRDSHKKLSINYTRAINEIERFAFDGNLDTIESMRNDINNLLLSNISSLESGRAHRSRSRSRSPKRGVSVGAERDTPGYKEIALDVLSKMSGVINLAIYLSAIKAPAPTNLITIKEILTKNGYKIDGAVMEEENAELVPLHMLPRIGRAYGDYHPRALRGQILRFDYDPISDFDGTTMRRIVQDASYIPVEPYRAGAGGPQSSLQQFSLQPCPFLPIHHPATLQTYTEKVTAAVRDGMHAIVSFLKMGGAASGTYMGGGQSSSRKASISPRSKVSLAALIKAVQLKVFYMNLFLSENKFAGSTLFLTEIYAATLISDYEALTSSKSKSKYVLIQSSITREPEPQSKSKSRSKTITSIIIASPPKVKSKRSVLFNSPEGKVKSIFKSQEEVKNKLIQQLIAFLWFGSSQSAEMKKLEKTVFASLLPDFVNNLSSVVHYQLFWMPFMNRTDIIYEDLYASFINVALPIMRSKPADMASLKVKKPSPTKTMSVRSKSKSATRKSNSTFRGKTVGRLSTIIEGVA